MKIEYRSKDEFELSYRKEIYEESEKLIQDHLWWNEPLTLYDKTEYPLYLTGESTLIRHSLNDEYGFRRSIDPKDDVYLALVDCEKLIEVLEALSAEHELHWKLFHTQNSQDEITIGHVIGGKADAAATQFKIQTLDRYGITQASLWDKELQIETYSKYFDENDHPKYEEPSASDPI